MARPTIIEKIFTILPKHLDANGEFDARQIAADQNYKGVKVDFAARSLLKKIKGKLPDSIEELNLFGCEKLKSLNAGNLSTHLKKLFLNNYAIEEIGKLPASLKILNLISCSNFKILDANNLPTNLEVLGLYKSEIETITGKFPASLKILNLIGCSNFKILDANNLPANLEEFSLKYSGIEEVTGKFPASLKILNLISCSNFKILDTNNLPANLEEFSLKYSGIEEVTGKFPDSIKKLDLEGCQNLKSLNPEILPDNLEGLNLQYCNKLEYNENLLLKLRELEGRGCVVHYPRHFLNKDQELVTNKLNAAIEKVKEIDGNFKAEKTKEIITQFLQKGVDQRGGMAAVISELSPILEFIEKNPESLFWIEEIFTFTPLFSSDGLPLCVNQPVAMVSEVTSWIELASQKTLPEKVEASKRLLTQNFLKEYISHLPEDKKIGQYVEIEAQNALFREVHKMMLEKGNIKQPWLGVPKSLYAEETITSWLKQPNIIQDAYNLVKTEALEADFNKLKELLSPQKAWRLIAFPEETKEMEKLLRAEYTILEAFIRFEEGLEESEALQGLRETVEESKKNLNEKQKVKLDEFYEIIKTKDLKILKESFRTSIDSIEQELVKFITPKTMEIDMSQMNQEVDSSKTVSAAEAAPSTSVSGAGAGVTSAVKRRRVTNDGIN